MDIVVTGGGGFIGQHVVQALADEGHKVFSIDNSSNTVIEHPTRWSHRDRAWHVYGNVCNPMALRRLLCGMDAIVHLAGGKPGVVPNAMALTLEGSTNVITEAEACGVRHLVFASSASVYGVSYTEPVSEECLAKPVTEYARTKLTVEERLAASKLQSTVSLRLFNPVGARLGLNIGERSRYPVGLFNALVGAAENGEAVPLFMADTHDGTEVRDFVHVHDVATAHVAALNYAVNNPAHEVFNIGRGAPVSALEFLNTFNQVTGANVCRALSSVRRPHEPGVLVAECAKARQELRWKHEFSLEEMCSHAWEFYKTHVKERPCMTLQ